MSASPALQVDGVQNIKVDSVYLQGLPVRHATFANDGAQVSCSMSHALSASLLHPMSVLQICPVGNHPELWPGCTGLTENSGHAQDLLVTEHQLYQLGSGALSAVVQQHFITLLLAELEPSLAVLKLPQLHTAELGATAGASGPVTMFAWLDSTACLCRLWQRGAVATSTSMTWPPPQWSAFLPCWTAPITAWRVLQLAPAGATPWWPSLAMTAACRWCPCARGRAWAP